MSSQLIMQRQPLVCVSVSPLPPEPVRSRNPALHHRLARSLLGREGAKRRLRGAAAEGEKGEAQEPRGRGGYCGGAAAHAGEARIPQLEEDARVTRHALKGKAKGKRGRPNPRSSRLFLRHPPMRRCLHPKGSRAAGRGLQLPG
ncbi:tetratricopeptide repeat protein 38 [Platysternon megacephalum]|uniref:Tetratricopeptide repeat protein 38 n=1 Tax=Platysternon megacephalum TaxID=55544 RepID=A0A4D9ECN8_9SAUR|nr:tetratricopeptide repeat protein 38 [Platysternon megacephalum]